MDNASALYGLLLPGCITIGVVFNQPNVDKTDDAPNEKFNLEAKSWTYKAMAHDGISVGDLVLVDSPRHGIVAVTVVRVDTEVDLEFSSNIRYKWIIGKVPLDAYAERNDREEQFRQQMVQLERKKRRETLLADLRERYGDNLALPTA